MISNRTAFDTWEALEISPNHVDIWLTNCGALSEPNLLPDYGYILTDSERQQHGRFHFAKDRHRYLVTRLLIRHVLSRYVPIKPQDWRFEATHYGKPFITNVHPVAQDLSFNISHSDSVVVVAIAHQRSIGIDIEDLSRKAPLEVADHFFSPYEVRQLRALPSAQQPRRFFDLWTLKESYIKARGKGLSIPLDQFSFSLDPQPYLAASFDSGLDEAPQRWAFWQWCPSNISLAALCVDTGASSHVPLITVRETIPYVSELITAFEPSRRSR